MNVTSSSIAQQVAADVIADIKKLAEVRHELAVLRKAQPHFAADSIRARLIKSDIARLADMEQTLAWLVANAEQVGLDELVRCEIAAA